MLFFWKEIQRHFTHSIFYCAHTAITWVRETFYSKVTLILRTEWPWTCFVTFFCTILLNKKWKSIKQSIVISIEDIGRYCELIK